VEKNKSDSTKKKSKNHRKTGNSILKLRTVGYTLSDYKINEEMNRELCTVFHTEFIEQ
jgi:hypothetical protein